MREKVRKREGEKGRWREGEMERCGRGKNRDRLDYCVFKNWMF
jgi:hypothetical protein